MKADLLRYRDTGTSTSGLLMIDGLFECHILERPWLDNKPSISCIPTGTYHLGLRTEGGWHNKAVKKFGDEHRGMIEVLDVPDRSYILMHWGNGPDDTRGCMLTGVVAQPNFVGQSVVAYVPVAEKITRRLASKVDNTVMLNVRNLF